MKSHSVFLLLLLAHISFGQSLSFFADVMINADNAEHRTYAAGEFATLVNEALNVDGSFQNEFKEIPWISIQYPQDSTFRIISWQIDSGDGNFEYRGFFQSEESLISIGPSQTAQFSENISVSMNEWDCGLVYKIISLPGNDDIYYLLSFQQLDQYTKSKTLNPLKLNNEGIPQIGIPELFSKGQNERPSSKLSIQYSADVNAGFTIDEETRRIVYDNLILVQGRLQGQGPAYVPDGSYKAYQLETDNTWTFVDKLYDQWNEGPLDPEFVKNRKDKISRKGKN